MPWVLRGRPWALGVVLFGLAAGAAANRPTFDRYEIILTRQPFGTPAPVRVAPGPDPMVPGPEAFIKNLRMAAITENNAGIRVGLVDIQSKPTKTYFLYVGDIEDGIELVEADFVTERALLRKGSEEYWISMGSGAVGGGGAAAVTAAASSGAAGSAARRQSYADRVRQRREAEDQRMRELAARPPVTPEELEKTLQKHLMEAIRRGEPPLPVPLTLESDEQLVAEGFLPPME